jgi:transcription antitermination factor NusG
MMARRHVFFCLVALPAVSCFYLHETRNGPAVSGIVPPQLPACSISKNPRRSSSINQQKAVVSAGRPRRSSTTLRASEEDYPLWHRLQMREDPEPRWYLINCVATFEMNLLAQCRAATAELSGEDVVKFVVPLERKTRSRGKKMVTENKVKFLGYVFAKLRLCPQTYEAIQRLPLCRSWMGSTNKGGIRRPEALGEEEIEKFGLEELEETDLLALESPDQKMKRKTDEKGLILIDDDGDDDGDDVSDTPEVDTEALNVYEGLKVDDMVKVTNKGSFYNEDGVVRRLQDGKIFVRFYTYGQMFEKLLSPKDVRKLKAEEILKGLTGPTKSITQEDLDRLQEQQQRQERNSDSDTPSWGQNRNRRQDRNEQRSFRPDNDRQFNRAEERPDWNSNQDQQRNRRTNDNSSFPDRDSRRITTPGTREWNSNSNSNDRGYRNAERYYSNDDSNNNNNAFAGAPRTFDRQNDRRDSNKRSVDNNQRGNNRQWNNDGLTTSGQDYAFVSNPGGKGGTSRTPPPPEIDDFFTSLMNDLNNDIEGSVPDKTQSTRQSASNNRDPPKRQQAYEDDFFNSLLSDLPQGSQTLPPKSTTTASDNKIRRNQSVGPATGKFDDDDFFASLEADLGEAVSSPQFSESNDNGRGKGVQVNARSRPSSNERRESAPSPRNANRRTDGAVFSGQSDVDDFFASLEAELNQGFASSNTKAESEDREVEELVGHFTPANPVAAKPAPKTATQAEKFVRTKSSNDVESPATLEAELNQGLAPSASRKAGNKDREAEVFVGQFTSVKNGDSEPAPEKPSTKTDKSGSKSPMSQGLEPTPSTVSEASLAKNTVPVLKEMLRERGLKVSGNKAELVERLLQ